MKDRIRFGNVLHAALPGFGLPARASVRPAARAARARRWPIQRVALQLPIVAVALFAAISPSAGQQSASYKLAETVFNAGGHPADGVVMTSTSHRLRFDTVGEAVVGTSLGSASFRADAGFALAYPPPGPVFGLSFSNRTTLRWNAERSIGSYDLYRDALTALSSGGYGTCLQFDLPSETASDTGTPPARSGWFYLVTAQNRLDEEGTKGTNSVGAERPNPAPCP